MTILDTQQARDVFVNVFVTLAHCIGTNNYSIASNAVRLDAAFDGSKLRHRAITISVEPNEHHANPDFYEIVVRDVRYHDGIDAAISHHTLGRLSLTSSPFNGCRNRDVAARIQALLKRDVATFAEWLKTVIDVAGIEIINIVDLAENKS